MKSPTFQITIDPPTPTITIQPPTPTLTIPKPVAVGIDPSTPLSGFIYPSSYYLSVPNLA
ncbi:hypothetical protein EW145_g6309, partial [Phellinidium pouzarii]